MDSTDMRLARRGDPLLSAADSIQRSNVGGCVTPPPATNVVSSNSSPVRSESEYFRELAELLQDTMGPSLQRADAHELRNMLLQLKQKGPRCNPVQDEDVSSSGSNSVLDPHLGSMVLEALDGFLFVLNSDGVLEYVSHNVQKYLKYAQADMQHQSIYNFVVPGDCNNFEKLLPDAHEWQMMQYCGPRERKSQTFRCTFYTKPQQQQQGDVNCVDLHVSAVSLPYPSDNNREQDDFFNTFATPNVDSESGACLVCVARRNCSQLVGEQCSATPSSVASPALQSSAPTPNNPPQPSIPSAPPSLSFFCSHQGQILAFECSNQKLQNFFPKDFHKSGENGQTNLRSLCFQQSDNVALNSLLDPGCTGYEGLCLRTPVGSYLATFQVRSWAGPAEHVIKLDCSLCSVSSPSVGESPASVPASPRIGDQPSPRHALTRQPSVVCVNNSPAPVQQQQPPWPSPAPSPVRPNYDPMSPQQPKLPSTSMASVLPASNNMNNNNSYSNNTQHKNTDTLSEICSSIFNDSPNNACTSAPSPLYSTPPDTKPAFAYATNNNMGVQSMYNNNNPAAGNAKVNHPPVNADVKAEFYSPPNVDNPYLYHPFSYPEQSVNAQMMVQRQEIPQPPRGGAAKATKTRKPRKSAAGRGTASNATNGEPGTNGRGRGRKKRGAAAGPAVGRGGGNRASPSNLVLPDSSGMTSPEFNPQYMPHQRQVYPPQAQFPHPQAVLYHQQPMHPYAPQPQHIINPGDVRYPVNQHNQQQMYAMHQHRMGLNQPPQQSPAPQKNQILKELLRPEAVPGNGAGSPCGVSSSGVQPPILSKLLNEADTSSPVGYYPGTPPAPSPVQPSSAPGSVAHSVPSPLSSPAPKRKPSSLSIDSTGGSSESPAPSTSKSMLVKLLEVPTPSVSSMGSNSVPNSPFDKAKQDAMNKHRVDTRLIEHMSRPRQPPGQQQHQMVMSPGEGYPPSQPPFSPQFSPSPQQQPYYPQEGAQPGTSGPPHLLMPSAQVKQRMASFPTSAPPYGDQPAQYMQYTYGGGPRTASPVFAFEQHPQWPSPLHRQQQQQLPQRLPAPNTQQGYGGNWPNQMGVPTNSGGMEMPTSSAPSNSNNDMNWLDLGLENGFDMDDENTRNLVQQLLS